MNTKLTVTIDFEVVERAKKYASDHGTSLSKLVEGYFNQLTMTYQISEPTASARGSRLRGILKGDR